MRSAIVEIRNTHTGEVAAWQLSIPEGQSIDLDVKICPRDREEMLNYGKPRVVRTTYADVDSVAGPRAPLPGEG